jgi:acyl-CoA synthetase (AMP-forming)/AMP-acid ligase II/MFS family permease/acyl carrier protein
MNVRLHPLSHSAPATRKHTQQYQYVTQDAIHHLQPGMPCAKQQGNRFQTSITLNPATEKGNTMNRRKNKIRDDHTFASMATAYSLGVFNDNFFKQAALLMAIGVGLTHLQGTATIVFALPFILCSAYAGWLADRFPKKNIVVNGKVLELVAMLFGAAGILFTNWFCILAMIFLMGLQSALFGPALNGSIPEHFPTERITRINGSLKIATTTAILIGIACAGFALDVQSPVFGTTLGQLLIAVTIVTVSLLGLIASLGMKKYQAAAPNKPFPWTGPLHSLRNFAALRKDPLLLLAVMSDAYFYFLAALTILIINTYGIDQLGFSQAITSLMSVALMVGVALGAIVASRVADTDNWTTVLLPGTSGMGAGLIIGALTPGLPEGYLVPSLFAAFILTGFCGGFFLIPITSFIQVRPKESDRGQVIAVAGFCSFIGILLAGQAYSIMDSVIEPGTMLLFAGLITLLTTLILLIILRWNQLVLSLLHRIMHTMLRLRYDIKITGLSKIQPSHNSTGILFLPNHPAWIDPVILMTALHKRFQPRPLADYDETNKFYIRPLIKLVNAIRIPKIAKNGRNSRDKVTGGIQTVATSLRQGDNVILYPAGQLYRSLHEKLGAKSAVHTILARNPGQRIVLIKTSGLWGSSFSWANGSPRLSEKWTTYLSFALANFLFLGPRRKVTIEFNEPSNFPRQADRITVNQTLEKFYNANPQPNCHVPYFLWQGRSSQQKPEPMDKTVARDLSNVSAVTKDLVLNRIREISGVETITERNRLAQDIGMDSLSIMEFAVWVEEEFGMPVEDLESLQTVGDLVLAACGQGIGTHEQESLKITPAWFQGDLTRDLQLPESDSIPQAFLRKAKANPGQMIIADKISGVKTYRQVVIATMILQKKLRKIDNPNLGIMLPPSVSASLCYFATLFAEKTPVMLNWTVGPGHMQHCLKTAGVTHVITARALMDKLQEQGIDLTSLDIEWIYLEDLRKSISTVDKLRAVAAGYTSWSSLARSRVSETAAILFTSGSEANPKAVPLSHANILANLQDFNSVLSFKESDRLLAMLPPFHSLGLAGNIIMPLCLGLKTTYHTNPTEGGVLANLTEQYKPTLIIGTPTFVNGILRAAKPGQLNSLRLLFTGAEKCPKYVYQQVKKELPAAILCEGYGITECSPVVSVNMPDAPVPETIGRVLPSMDYTIVHPDTMDAIEPGQRGVLLVRGKNVFSGYLGTDAASPFVTVNGKEWYNTGDLVREDASGVLTFCGRLKRFIKLGGEMISLPAIESVLQQYFPADADGAPTLAIEATNDEIHPQVVLFTTFSIDREKVNRCIREAGLSALHNIRQSVKIDMIPVLGTGKINYRQLKTALT